PVGTEAQYRVGATGVAIEPIVQDRSKPFTQAARNIPDTRSSHSGAVHRGFRRSYNTEARYRVGAAEAAIEPIVQTAVVSGLLHLAPQIIEQVDAGDQAQKLVAVGDDGH